MRKERAALASRPKATPAEHGESGVMTFIVNQRGCVYQRDLGKDTSRIVRKMSAYDPDPDWHASAA
jgi:hypothetical protein